MKRKQFDETNCQNLLYTYSEGGCSISGTNLIRIRRYNEGSP